MLAKSVMFGVSVRRNNRFHVKVLYSTISFVIPGKLDKSSFAAPPSDAGSQTKYGVSLSPGKNITRLYISPFGDPEKSLKDLQKSLCVRQSAFWHSREQYGVVWQLPQTFEGLMRHIVHSVGLGLADISSGRRKDAVLDG
jgi:hypothetical protein